jgi:PAS domain S-box-containing protein
VEEPSIPFELRDYFERSNIALALAAAEPDNPLVLVNEKFRSLTGYADDDVIGRNCRLLQKDVENREARERIHAFLEGDAQASVRTPIINFRKNGEPFVNLLYMSKLRDRSGRPRFLFASQYDISRSHPERLAEYDAELARTLSRMTPALSENGIVIEGTLMAIANAASLIAQAKVTLSDLDGPDLS